MNENIKKLINENKIKILGASKTKTINDIYNLYNEGITIFGENYVQELKEKYTPNLPFEFHYIGKLQTNKIKDIVPRVTLIHSVSRIKELNEINKECIKLNKNMNILIELHLTNEDTKNGVNLNELDSLINEIKNYPNITLKGFMTMGPLNDDLHETEKVFIKAHEIYLKYKEIFPLIDTLSMGMSNDYELAIKHGSTLIRLGTILFGKRNY